MGGAKRGRRRRGSSAPLILLHLIRHVLRDVEDGVERVDLRDLHLRAVGEDHVLVKLSLRQYGIARRRQRGVARGWAVGKRRSRTAFSDFSKMARTGGHVPTVTVAPASASAFAIAQP